MFFIGNAVALTDLTRDVTSQRKSKVVGSALVGVLILLALISITGMSEVYATLNSANLVWIGVAGIVYLGSFAFRTWRWRVLLRTSGEIASRGGVFRSIMAGWFINFLVPARAGDVLRGLALKTTEGVPFSVGASTIVIGRIFDMLVLGLGMFVITVSFVNEWYTFYLGVGALLIASVLLIGLSVVYWYGDWITELPGDQIVDLEESIKAVQDALKQSINNPYAMTLALLLSVPIWSLEASTLFFAGRALGLTIPPVPVLAAGIAAFVSQAVPVTPAGIGTYEAAITAVLSLSGVDQSIATSLSLLDHFTRLAFVYVVGAVSIVHIGFRSRSYFRDKRKETTVSAQD